MSLIEASRVYSRIVFTNPFATVTSCSRLCNGVVFLQHRHINILGVVFVSIHSAHCVREQGISRRPYEISNYVGGSSQQWFPGFR